MNIAIADPALTAVLGHHPGPELGNFLMFGELVSAGCDPDAAMRIVRSTEAQVAAVARCRSWFLDTAPPAELVEPLALAFLCGAGLDHGLAVAWASVVAHGGGPARAVCRACGCTDGRPCAGGCSWVAADLCSACVEGGAP
jgi:hypothetical protein